MAQYVIDSRPAPIDFECRGAVARTLQNAKNLLMCRKGEVPYDRRRGFDPALLDLPLPALQDALLEELDRVMEDEPDAEVVDGACWLDAAGGVVIQCTVEIDLAP